ncbi:hypothetical protein MASR1M65_21090 [Saprospiraceae bacterium]
MNISALVEDASISISTTKYSFRKKKTVQQALQRIGKVAPESFEPILAAEHTSHYRNKLEFAYSSLRWLTREEMDKGATSADNVLGFHGGKL